MHLPSSVGTSKSLDDKDPRFPRDLKQVVSKRPLKRAFEKIYEIISTGDVSALLFMGDFTNFGEIDGYRSCAAYIANALQVGTKGHLHQLPLGIVSGNHDIDRALAKLPSYSAKFQPLTTALADFGLPGIPIREPVWLDVQASSVSASIALLNSCWGCGSSEFIPEEFRQDVQEAIDRAINRGKTKREIAAYYERQFDTPAFSDETIQKLVEGGTRRSSNMLIVAAHHNLLPQRLPRLAPYTELVNSGALRFSLQELGQPVVYLHGHIHQDPVEVLSSPGGLPLVTISAPEIVDGFNLLEFVFNRGGMPLCCRIVKWRFDNAGFIRPNSPISVSLIGLRRRSHRSSLSQLYQIILSANEIYWDDLQTRAAPLYSLPADLEEDLELLETDSRVTIENYGMGTQHWIIGAKI